MCWWREPRAVQRGQPTTSMTVRLRVGSVDKRLRVLGDRRWRRGAVGIGLGPPEAFSRMPVVYERTYGGANESDADRGQRRWEPRNPVGTGFATAKEHLTNQLAPNIEAIDDAYSGWQDGTPACFGPVARHWAPRLAFAGTYDAQWERSRKPLVPADFDDRFYQCAPEDQQVEGLLKGGEQVDLEGMTSEGVWSFRLPRITLALTTRFYDGTLSQHRASLHTVVLLPNEGGFYMVWHSGLPCHHKVNKLQVTRIALKRHLSLSATSGVDEA